MKRYDDIEEIMREEYFDVPDVLDVYYDFEPSAADPDNLDYINEEAYIDENPKNAICALLEITPDEYDNLCRENNEYVKECVDTYESLYEECGKEWNTFLESFIEAKENLLADTVDKMKKIAEIFEGTEGYLPYENDHFYTLALLWYQEAAELGDADAQFSCAMHWYGLTGWCPDNKYENEIKWFTEAAKQGDDEALEYLKEESNWNEYEDTLAYLAEGDSTYADMLVEEADDGNDYARELLEENFYFENDCEYSPVGIFTDYTIDYGDDEDEDSDDGGFYHSLNYIMDSFTSFVIEGSWHTGMKDSNGNIIKDKLKWPEPVKNENGVEWIYDNEKYEPVLWFGPDYKSPIEEWIISKEDTKFSDFHGETWWKAFWFPRRLYNWDILLGENSDYAQAWMFGEFGLKEPDKRRLMKNCPIELDKGDTNEELKKKIDEFFLEKYKRIHENDDVR